MSTTTPVAVITGASSGIGKQVAIGLARQGWRIICTGRNADRMAAAKAAIERESPAGKVDMLQADLSLIAGAAHLASDIARLTDRLDLLVNNAGGMTDKLEVTSEGLEANFAGNHLGPFSLTLRLLPLMQKTARGQPAGSVRILFTSSDASEMLPVFNVDDLQSIDNFNPGLAYCTGKLANVLFARELANRVADSGIVAHAVHPGPVDTNFYSYVPDETREHTKDLSKFSEQEGADTLLWLATSDEGAHNSGSYWYQRQIRKPNALAEDEGLLRQFWEESERLVNSARL